MDFSTSKSFVNSLVIPCVSAVIFFGMLQKAEAQFWRLRPIPVRPQPKSNPLQNRKLNPLQNPESNPLQNPKSNRWQNPNQNYRESKGLFRSSRSQHPDLFITEFVSAADYSIEQRLEMLVAENFQNKPAQFKSQISELKNSKTLRDVKKLEKGDVQSTTFVESFIDKVSESLDLNEMPRGPPFEKLELLTPADEGIRPSIVEPLFDRTPTVVPVGFKLKLVDATQPKANFSRASSHSPPLILPHNLAINLTQLNRVITFGQARSDSAADEFKEWLESNTGFARSHFLGNRENAKDFVKQEYMSIRNSLVELAARDAALRLELQALRSVSLLNPSNTTPPEEQLRGSPKIQTNSQRLVASLGFEPQEELTSRLRNLDEQNVAAPNSEICDFFRAVFLSSACFTRPCAFRRRN